MATSTLPRLSAKHRARRVKSSQCRHCSLILYDRRSRNAHEISIHTHLKLFKCKGCPKSFKWNSSASRCLRKHRENGLMLLVLQLAATNKQNEDHVTLLLAELEKGLTFDIEGHLGLNFC